VDFTTAMANDLDTPHAGKVIGSLADEILQASEREEEIVDAQRLLRSMTDIFGLVLDRNSPELRVLDDWNKHLRKVT
jgi:cysteinyl-tRNA synthetase